MLQDSEKVRSAYHVYNVLEIRDLNTKDTEIHSVEIITRCSVLGMALGLPDKAVL